jgi:RNA polymerase sigma-70 factor (ECF subfamily)
MSGLPYALSKWLNQKDPRFDALTEEVAQETILRVLDKLDTFEGRSQFTTWVYTISVRIALTELRRAKWREISLENFLEGKDVDDDPKEIPNQDSSVEDSLEITEVMKVVSEIMENILTEKQQLALKAVVVGGMPLEEVARRMGTNRNALYKLLHDARLKMKISMEEQGFASSDIFGMFEKK